MQRDLRAQIAVFLGSGRPERAWDRVAAAYDDGLGAARHDARRLLAALCPQLPAAAWDRTRQDLAARLQLRPPEPQLRVGVMAFPVVQGDTGRFVTATVALAQADAICGWPDHAATQQAVADALAAARAVLGSEQGFAVTLDAGQWSGDSCGLAIGLAALSAASGVGISDLAAATGRLTPDGAVHHVGGEAEKLALRRQARPRSWLLAPSGWQLDHPDIHRTRHLSAARDLLEIPDDVGLDTALREVRRLDGGGRWQAAARGAGRLLQAHGLEEAERVELLSLRLLAANHLGDTEGAQEVADTLGELQVTGMSGQVFARAVSSQAVAAIDRLDAGRARALLALSDTHLPDAARIHLLGTRALLATLEGNHGRAFDLRFENLAQAPLREQPRCQGDLADALLRAGHPDEARVHIEPALRKVRRMGRYAGYYQQSRPYAVLHAARIFRACGDAAAASRVLDEASAPWPDPGFRLCIERAILSGDVGRLDAGWARLPAWAKDSLIFKLLRERALAALGEPGELLALAVDVPVLQGLSAEAVGARIPY
jgi:hypothetical protein